ncbi:MAG: hypothetical protein ACLRMZ_06580 [Blautia marasmi]
MSAGTKFIGIYTFLWMIGGLLGAAFIGCEMEGLHGTYCCMLS